MTALDFLKAMSYTNSGPAKEFLKTPIVNIDGECRGLVIASQITIPVAVSETAVNLNVSNIGNNVTVSEPEKMVSVKIIKKEVIHE